MFNFLPRNAMLFDLGFDNLEAANNETAVDDMIRQVDENFNMVLMVERYVYLSHSIIDTFLQISK